MVEQDEDLTTVRINEDGTLSTNNLEGRASQIGPPTTDKSCEEQDTVPLVLETLPVTEAHNSQSMGDNERQTPSYKPTRKRPKLQANSDILHSCLDPLSSDTDITSCNQQQRLVTQSSSRLDSLLMPPPATFSVTAAQGHAPYDKQVVYVCSRDYLRACSSFQVHKGRDVVLWSLIAACELPKHLRLISPKPASAENLTAYHTKDYVEALRQGCASRQEAEFYGLVDDCAPFENLWNYCIWLVGAVQAAVSELVHKRTQCAISWAGGRHHAKKSEASGYCYVNDVVLAILQLQKGGFERILYLDIDIHHGDGVEEAFIYTSSVYTISFHKYSPGFFPGTGKPGQSGRRGARYTNLNVPLPDGITDSLFCNVFDEIVEKAVKAFRPSAIVLVCGADVLSRDPIGTFNLTSKGIISCVSAARSHHLPLLLLGGGGYCRIDTARAWTLATAAAIGPEIVRAMPRLVPDNMFLPEFGPDFLLHTKSSSSRRLAVSAADVMKVKQRALHALEQYQANQES